MVRFGDDSVPKAMIEAGQTVMAPIAARIAARLRSEPARASGAMASTVRVSKIRTGASMRVGDARRPYVGPLEFGGYPRPGRGVSWAGGGWSRSGGAAYTGGGGRPFRAGGRYIFPTAGDMAPEAARQYSELIQQQINSFPWSQAHD